MTSALLVLAPTTPLVLAAALLARPLVAPTLALAAWAPVPALALALLGRDGATVSLPPLLLGTELALDATGRAFLMAAAGLWLASGVYARSALRDDLRVRRFTGLFLLTSAGNFCLVVAADAATFALGFAVMTFSAYVLVVHDGTERAFRAGRFTIALAVLGEALLLGGMLVGISAAGSLALADIPAGLAGDARAGVAVALLLAGFGIKAGIVPLHFWLPLAHPVAPTPASAVLSGAMIAAGVLGWLRFLPLGELQLAGWGSACVVLGLATAFYGVAVGVVQDDAKTNLAYSSVSQMGLALVAVGVALARPEAWPLAGGAATFQAVQHGLAKGALFLGIGVVAAAAGRRARIATLGGLAACSLALAGAPLTSGAVAKSTLETPLESLEWAGPMALLSLTGAATTVLLGRFLLLSWRASGTAGEPASVSMWGAWLALVAAALGSTWAAPALLDLPGVTSYGLSAAGVLASAWPVVLGIGLLVALVTTGLDRALPRVPPGDIALPAGSATSALAAVVRGVLAMTTSLARRTARAVSETRLVRGAGAALDALESRLLDLAVAGTALLALGLAITALLLGGGPSR